MRLLIGLATARLTRSNNVHFEVCTAEDLCMLPVSALRLSRDREGTSFPYSLSILL